MLFLMIRSFLAVRSVFLTLPAAAACGSLLGHPETHFKTQVQLDSETAQSFTDLYHQADNSQHLEVLLIAKLVITGFSLKTAGLEDNPLFFSELGFLKCKLYHINLVKEKEKSFN